MSDKKRYLLECEIVGGEIVNPAGKKLVYSVCVSPVNRIRKSDLIGGSQVLGVAVEEDPANRFHISSETPSLLAVSLNEQELAEISLSNESMATALLSCNGMRVVLELDKNLKTVVGFKAQF